MKKGLIFGIGFLSGAVVCFLVLAVIGLASQNPSMPRMYGATYFDEPTKVFKATSFKVLQVVQDDAALAYMKKNANSYSYDDPLCLIVNDSGHYYYDEEIINVPSGYRVLQIGLYKYTAKSGVEKTVPMVCITE